ncbi:hypothetical protein OG372_33180 [Streptomyces sp. NBC_01020]|nr:hypothetical protein OG372_33180 [Streptomyces sp. NBC_01020]WSX65814.1 hypothetical protein OG221_03845 [Streptomyces sp. NBC_00932]
MHTGHAALAPPSPDGFSEHAPAGRPVSHRTNNAANAAWNR